MCETLPAAHVLTGCDSTSALDQLGKRSMFTTLIKHVSELEALHLLGTSSALKDDYSDARQFILLLCKCHTR